jgi:hypothetical protein
MVAEKQCETCSGAGSYEVCECPYQYVGGLVELSHYSQLMRESGLLPQQGGLLDQSNWFITAERFLTSQKNGIKQREING